MNGMLGVVKRSTSGSPTDISGRNTKLLGFVAKTLVPFSKNVTFSLGLYSLITRGETLGQLFKIPVNSTPQHVINEQLVGQKAFCAKSLFC